MSSSHPSTPPVFAEPEDEIVGLTNTTILANQVRASSGATFAPGCINPDSRRMRWDLMQCRMGGQRKLRFRPAVVSLVPVKPPSDYPIPPDIKQSLLGQLYQALRAHADRGDDLPSRPDLQAELGLVGPDKNIALCLRQLEEMGHISLEGSSRNATQVTMIATGQVMRTALSMGRNRNAA